uniref:Uncharacterized protein n=1 Tax=Acrobeloides nanus TaxID=290746 RepID=A0A914DL62_9BILA
MASTIKLSLGGYTIVFFITLLCLVVLVIGILIYRQIQRLRKNNARKEVNLTAANDVSESCRQNIQAKIQAVGLFKKIHYPKFTDCTMIAEHANTPYVHRMIAFDEVIRDVDRQLEVINPELARRPGQSTYAYLYDIKELALPELQTKFIERLSFLHDASRYRAQFAFGEEELAELRNLLREFVRM